MTQRKEVVLEAIKGAEKIPGLIAHNLAEFLALDIPPRDQILAPILQTQSLAMIYAKRGIGKTHIALNIAYAIASGGKFLQWQAPVPRKVLYLDGEMPARAMQERLAAIIKESDKEAAPDYFRLITPDMQELGMPDISTEEGQAKLEPFIEDAEFIIVDNISTLARTGKENEAEGWLPIQGWALRLRSRGKSVLFVHHAGKGGQQRGTSRREDVLDLVIELKQPEDYSADQGARFEVHFVKARHLTGLDAKPFEAQLGAERWTYRSIENSEMKRIVELKEQDGMTYREIALELGISKTKAERLYKKFYDQKFDNSETVPPSRLMGAGQGDNYATKGTDTGQDTGQ
ncbi:MAG: AAA family ATPase [Alphaproteobacteria bacterium]